MTDSNQDNKQIKKSLEDNIIWFALGLMIAGAIGAVSFMTFLNKKIDDRIDWLKQNGKIATVGSLSEKSPNLFPKGMIIAFSGEKCPPMWDLLPNSPGRYLVGLHPGNKPGTKIGTELRHGENRATGAHNHNYSYVQIEHNGKSNDGLSTTFNGSSNVKINVSVDSSTKPNNEINGTPELGTNAPYLTYLFCEKG